MLGRIKQLFGAKTTQPNAAALIHFKSNEAAFQMDCKYTGTRVAEGTIHVALVLTVEPNYTPNERPPILQLAISDGDGMFETFGMPLPQSPWTMKEGDLVTWQAVSFQAEAAAKFEDPVPAGSES